MVGAAGMFAGQHAALMIVGPGRQAHAALRHHEAYHAAERAQFNADSQRRLQAFRVQHELADAQREAETHRQRHVELEQAHARLNDLHRALVAADDSFDVSVAKGTRQHLKDAGMQLSLDESFRDGGGEFSSIVSQIKSSAVDAVLWTGHETDARNFIRQAKSLDANPKDFYSFTVGVPTADFRQALGKDAN